MRKLKYIIALLVAVIPVWCHGQFAIERGDRSKINFDLVGNLTVVPVQVNGVQLSFLLDTGVKNTIIFSLEDKEYLELKSADKVRLRGLGNADVIEALRSYNNKVKIGGVVNPDQTIYVIYDQSFNVSTHLGKTIHGIIGYDFFKNFVVETNYVRKKLFVYKPEEYDAKRRCRRCVTLPLKFHNDKPYLDAQVQLGDEVLKTTLLIDSGSSDGLWLFQDGSTIKTPENSFADYLGLGLTGGIFGDRSRVESLKIDDYILKGVTTAFPDTTAISSAQIFDERNGSVGAEVLKRFKFVIDYQNKRILLRKNKNFSEDFNYDMSGLFLAHNGFRVVKQAAGAVDAKVISGNYAIRNSNSNATTAIVNNTSIFEYALAPQLEITIVTKGTPAYEAGLKEGDIVLRVNNKPAHRYSLQELATLFSEEEYKTIKMDIERNGVKISKTFKLRKRL